MTRIVLLAIALLLPGAAFAQDAQTKTLIKRWYMANEICRGGVGDGGKADAACEVRDDIREVLDSRNWCIGKKRQSGVEMQWHRCTKDSLRAWE